MKLLMLKYQGPHFEPSIYAITPKLGTNQPKNHFYNVFNIVDEGQKMHLVDNMSVTLNFTKKIR